MTDTVTGWVSVEDRLPPDREFVLVLCPSGYTTIKNTVVTARLDSIFRGNGWIDHANDLLTEGGLTPTHWKPMDVPSTNGKVNDVKTFYRPSRITNGSTSSRRR